MTKHDFKLHTVETAPEGARNDLAQLKQKFGRIPNFFAVAAESPAAVKAYLSLSEIFRKSSLNAVEQQIVIIAASAENKCAYCVAAHSRGAKMTGVPDDIIQPVAGGMPLKDAKLEALRKLAVEAVKSRGWVSEDAIQAFFKAGYTKAQMLDVLVGVSMKTLSNYVNHIAETPHE